MHTPGHVVLNLALLGSVVGHESAVIAGALLPDVPIVVLYLRERLRGTPPATIWSVCYQRKFWLAVIHGAHSVPLSLLGMGIALLAHSSTLIYFFLSVLCHALCDLPLHVHDAHRHFFPLSSYRFISPWSYWDARYHGRKVALLELLLVLLCSLYLYLVMAPRWTATPKPLVLALLCATNLWYAQNYYRSFLRR